MITSPKPVGPSGTDPVRQLEQFCCRDRHTRSPLKFLVSRQFRFLLAPKAPYPRLGKTTPAGTENVSRIDVQVPSNKTTMPRPENKVRIMLG
jgi:hypothetical protein